MSTCMNSAHPISNRRMSDDEEKNTQCRKLSKWIAAFAIALLIGFSSNAASACPGDFDGNGRVDIADFLSFVDVYGSSSSDSNYNAQMDLDSNGSVNIADFLAFVNVYGSECDSSSGGGGSSEATTRIAFQTFRPSDYASVNLKDNGTVWGAPMQYTDDSDIGTVAYMLLAKIKGCSFADAEADRGRKVYIKTQALGRLSSFVSESVCRKTSRSYGSWPRGVRITHLRFFDESSPTNVQEAVYNTSTGQYRLDQIEFESGWDDRLTIYWSEANGIWRINRTGAQLLITTEVAAGDLALDVAGGKMYWTSGHNKIWRADLNGSNVENIYNSGISDLALDTSGGKIYWTATDTTHWTEGQILRANLDGSNVQLIASAFKKNPHELGGLVGAPHHIAVAGSKMYWLNPFSIYRADINGSNGETLVEGDATPYIVFQGPLAGWGHSFALDVAEGKMYWTVYNPKNIEYEPAPYKHTTIRRANLDGTNVENFITKKADGWSDVLVWAVAGGKVYWTEGGYQIWRANPDGTNVEEIFNIGSAMREVLDLYNLTGISTPYSVAVDVGSGR